MPARISLSSAGQPPPGACSAASSIAAANQQPAHPAAAHRAAPRPRCRAPAGRARGPQGPAAAPPAGRQATGAKRDAPSSEERGGGAGPMRPAPAPAQRWCSGHPAGAAPAAGLAAEAHHHLLIRRVVFVHGKRVGLGRWHAGGLAIGPQLWRLGCELLGALGDAAGLHLRRVKRVGQRGGEAQSGCAGGKPWRSAALMQPVWRGGGGGGPHLGGRGGPGQRAGPRARGRQQAGAWQRARGGHNSVAQVGARECQAAPHADLVERLALHCYRLSWARTGEQLMAAAAPSGQVRGGRCAATVARARRAFAGVSHACK